MAGSVSEDSGVGRSSEVISSNQRCQSTDSLAEWRSCEQVENGTPSTSPPYWDTDDDDDCGAKPSDLYGKFTWKIENFSQISKRELRSNAFEVGGYKWYILVYPQGCDVCNHLSLFLCVANHDKLLPGWSHFAQFTIAVVNKDPKKSKYSDTLHRFWKKEHDWGWKKFMELSKVFDGFIVSDTLVIKAQVQVIREKAHRPFRCLDCLYRRELVRVYLTNVEGICRRFVEERRGKLTKLIEDEMRWSSFRAFWLGVDQNARRRMSREETDAILKVVVKHFFIEKEVTSTLVMDSLYSGLKALECQTRNKKGRAKISELDEAPAPVVRVEKDMFVLADDVLLLLERIAREPLPPSKDDKGPQNRTKDGSSGEDFNKDSIERDERRLTELGRRTVEIFVLAHIFSNRIEVAYQEAVALKRQEELIREEEAAGQAESELKAKRGTAEKEKRTKKKQAKQKRSSRKGKERGRDEKSDASIQEKHPQESPSGESTLEDFSTKQTRSALEKADVVEDVSVGSDTGDDVAETRPDVEERDGRPVNWDTDTLEMHLATEACTSEPIQNGQTEKKNCTSVMDDSSSTCSTDSVPSVVRHSPYKGNSLPNYKCKMSPNRGKNQRVKGKHGQSGWAQDTDNQPLDAGTDTSHARDDSSSCQDNGPEPEAVVLSLKDRIQWLEQHLVEKEEEVVSLQRKLSVKDPVNLNRLPKQKAAEAPSSPNSPTSSLSPSRSQPKQTTETTGPAMEPVPARETSSNSPSPSDKTAPLIRLSPQLPATSKLEPQKPATLSKPASIPTERPVNAHQLSALSRPSSAPLIPDPRPTAPAVSVVQTSPLLARSFSAAGRLGTDPSPATSSLSHCLPVAQSYRNAIMGKAVVTGSAGFTPCLSSANLSPTYSQATSSPLPSSVLLAQSPMAKDQSTGSTSGSGSGFTFGTVTPEILHNPNPWMDDSYLLSEIRGLDLYGGASRPLMHFTDEVSSATSSWQTQGVLPDEFPHLDIINYLLDEEHSIGKAAAVSAILQHPGSGPHLNRQFTFPGDMGMVDMVGPSFNCCRFDRSAKYNEEGIRNVYGSSGAPSFDRPRENHQSGLSAYTLSSDGQVDGMAHSQWPLGPTDLSLLSTRNAETDAYPYQMLDYSNIGCSLNSYGVFRPSNGH